MTAEHRRSSREQLLLVAVVVVVVLLLRQGCGRRPSSIRCPAARAAAAARCGSDLELLTLSSSLQSARRLGWGTGCGLCALCACLWRGKVGSIERW